MITTLRINDFAIIDQLELELKDGLIILTGETGAGKSIILDAIQALLGGSVQPVMVRAGAQKAHLEAVVQIGADQPELSALLESEDLQDEPGIIVLEREIRSEGRSSARINGHSVSQSTLREIGSFLIDIHGQSEHLSLLNDRTHIKLLDRFAKNSDLLREYQEQFHRLSNLKKELHELEDLEKDAQSRSDLISFQLNEINAARLKQDEDVELESERNRLANAENLSSLGDQALSILDESPGEIPSIADQLGQVSHLLVNLARIDPAQSPLADQASNLIDLSDEIVRNIRHYTESIESNPKRLIEIEERLVMINQLKKKYGGSITAILDFAEKLNATIEKVSSAGEQIEQLRSRIAEQIKELAVTAEKLSETRQFAAQNLSEAIENELKELHMVGARFKARIDQLDAPDGLSSEKGRLLAFDSNGIDQVEFLIAPNPGEGLKPLIQIASGGETSRLMLALKNVLSLADPVPTLIFDEIDQGIGGRVGMVVGAKLWHLARNHQVFCVTHLPQLAAFGDEHFHVSKQVEEGRTYTRVTEMSVSNRVTELAQMLGTVSENTLKSAEDLLHTVDTIKAAHTI